MSFIIIVFLLVIGLPFFGVGLYEAYGVIKMETEFKTVQGTVVGNDYFSFVSEGAAYRPIVEFKTVSGENVRFTDEIGSFPADYQVKENVQVLYDPNKPDNAHIKTWKRLWLGSTIFMLIGCLPLAVFLIIRSILRRKGHSF